MVNFTHHYQLTLHQSGLCLPSLKSVWDLIFPQQIKSWSQRNFKKSDWLFRLLGTRKDFSREIKTPDWCIEISIWLHMVSINLSFCFYCFCINQSEELGEILLSIDNLSSFCVGKRTDVDVRFSTPYLKLDLINVSSKIFILL